MSDAQWRPSVGERVAIYGTVLKDDESDTMPFQVATVPGGKDYGWYRLGELHPLPAPPSPRPAWETLREAADILAGSTRCIPDYLRDAAAKLEAAAAPKPPTLAEAVRAFLTSCTATDTQAAIEAMGEALARAEAEAGQ